MASIHKEERQSYPATGKLRCSLTKPESGQNWWLVLDRIPEGIAKFYRHLHWLHNNKIIKLSSVYWGSHVTVVRNEEPPNQELWWTYGGEEIEFQYFSGVRSNYSPERFRSFWWVDVICPRFDEIRKELGLLPNPDRTYHMTIGTWDNEENRHIYENMWKDSSRESRHGSS